MKPVNAYILSKNYTNQEVNKVKGGGSPQGVYATLADLQTAKPTGATGVYVVTADGNWYYWNGTAWTAGGVYQATGLADGGVVPVKLSDYVQQPSANSFYSDIESGVIGFTDGALGTSATAIRSVDFDIVEPNTDYVLFIDNISLSGDNGSVAVCTYDANQNYIERITRTGNNKYVAFNSGTTVKYIKSLITAIDTTGFTVDNLRWMLTEGTAPVAYVPPDSTSYKLIDLKIPDVQSQLDTINSAKNKSVFSNGFKYVAYSGYSQAAPINTIEAFNTAKILGFDCVKVDIRITSDDEIVLSHDATVDAMTDGTGVIRDMTLAQIKALKVDISTATNYFNYDLRIATLDEFLLCCKKNSLIPFINLRDEYMDIIIPKIIDRLKYYNIYETAVWQSFYSDSLWAVRNAGSDNLCLNILGQGEVLTETHIAEAKGLGNCGIECFDNIGTMTADLVSACRANGVPLEYAIVNDLATAQQAIDLGFDGILTDGPYNENSRHAVTFKVELETADNGTTWAQATGNPKNVYLTSTATTNTVDNTIDVVVDQIQTNWLRTLRPDITFRGIVDYGISAVCWFDRTNFVIKIKLFENGSEATLGALGSTNFTGVLSVVI